MKLISHRGNTNGINSQLENCEPYIEQAEKAGYDVEVDVWMINHSIWLGHDKPERPTGILWLLDHKNSLWVHAKNVDALDFLLEHHIRVFFHEQESHVIIGNTKHIWSHDIKESTEKSVIPLLSMVDVNSVNLKNLNVYGVCSDFVSVISERLT